MDGKIQYIDHIQHYKIDGDFYDYFNIDKFTEQESRRRYEEFFHLQKVKENDRILEIGSGGGIAVKLLKKTNVRYFPLDIPLNNLESVKRNAYIPIFPIAGDVYKLPFHQNSFDIIVISEVVEHLEDPLPALLEVHRVLKDNGVLAVSVPYREKITYQICVHCNKPTPTHSHLHSFDENKLSTLVSSAGLKPQIFSKSCNKVSSILHINILLRGIPFRLWKIMDDFLNFIIPKPASLILIAKK